MVGKVIETSKRALEAMEETVERYNDLEQTLQERARISRMPPANGGSWRSRLWRLQQMKARAIEHVARGQELIAQLERTSDHDQQQSIVHAMMVMRSELRRELTEFWRAA